ncbi:MAG: hypothetical protein E3K37_04955 [Candidatus Kuenenia sp.]|nr:hypothetical protein [Candidatus Kuenenia hertensis]
MENKKHEPVNPLNENRGLLREINEINITRKLILKGMSWFGYTGEMSVVSFLIQTITGAQGGLIPIPKNQSRRTYLHLLYSIKQLFFPLCLALNCLFLAQNE